MSRDKDGRGPARRSSRGRLATLGESIAREPLGSVGPLLGVGSTFLAAHFLGAWAAAPVTAAWALPLGWALHRRVGQLGRAVEHYHLLAMTDDLTGLANDRSFRGLRTSGTSGVSGGGPLTVVLVDVDRFKAYNDTFGHPAGDEALRAIGRAIAAASGEDRAVYRVGGDEFALILPEMDTPAAMALADQLRAAVEGGDWPLRRITASFGLATIDRIPPGFDPSQLRREADRALYRAKAAGGNRVVGQDDEEFAPD